MSNVLLGPAAAQDIRRIHRWNEDQLQGLGDEFLEELGHFLEATSLTPAVHDAFAPDVRRGRLVKFPFTVFYRIQERQFIVLGVWCNKNTVLLHPSGST
jgi:toxin ParE1/3/4